jgi:Uma2 family endonuclease
MSGVDVPANRSRPEPTTRGGEGAFRIAFCEGAFAFPRGKVPGRTARWLPREGGARVVLMALPALPLAADPSDDRDRDRDRDQRVILYGVPWAQYEALLALRGEGAGVRMTYLQGALELMSPSINHEAIKTLVARLVEAYAEEANLPLNGYGSWTLRSEPKERGLEPDECYVLGTPEADVPDLAIEIAYSRGGLNKLDVYRGLGVREVWLWHEGSLAVYVLNAGAYERAAASALLPELDLELLLSFVDHRSQTASVRAYRQALRARGVSSA